MPPILDSLAGSYRLEAKEGRFAKVSGGRSSAGPVHVRSEAVEVQSRGSMLGSGVSVTAVKSKRNGHRLRWDVMRDERSRAWPL